MGNVITSESYDKAVSLNKKIKANAMIAQESLYEVCKGLKEMRNGKLYKELGYINFENYCEVEVGMKRHMAYKYCSIAEIENVEPVQHLGVTKLSILATLSEPEREEVIKKVDIEAISKRELEKQIKQLKEERDKINGYTQELSEKLDEANKETRELNSRLSVMKTDKEMLETANEQLQSKIEELESRPIDIAVADNSQEIENMRQAMKICDKQWSDKYADKEEENLKLVREIENLKDKLENQKSDLSDAENFRVRLMVALDAGNKLISYVKAFPLFKNEAIRRLKEIIRILEGI